MLPTIRARAAGSVRARAKRAWLAEGLLALPVLAVLCIVLLRQAALLDTDYFWHLATGQLILRAGYPTVEPFAWTHAGLPWRPQDWLSDSLLAWLYGGFGHAGPVAAASLVGLAAWLVAYTRARLLGAGRMAALTLVTLGLVAIAPLVAVRPLMVLWLGLSLATLLVERALLSGAWWPLPALPLLAAAWVNLHRGAPPAMAALAGLAAVHLIVLAVWRARAGGLDAARLARRAALWLVVAGLTAAAGALTPTGLEGLIRSLVIVSDPSQRILIQEWHSPDFHRPDLRPFELLLLGGLLLFGRWGPRRVELWPYAGLLVLGTAAAALESMRHIALYALLAGPWLAAAPPLPAAARLRLRPAVAAALAVVSLLLLGAGLLGLDREQLRARETQAYPRAAVDWLQAQGPAGRLFNEYDWGGYLLWRGVPVFVDSRSEMVYDGRFLFRVQEALTAGPGWRDLILRDYPVDGALLRPDTPLAGALRAEGWAICWSDPVAVVLRPRCS